MNLNGSSRDPAGVSRRKRRRNARVEEARRASEARYRSLFECAPDGILIADSMVASSTNGSNLPDARLYPRRITRAPSSKIVAGRRSPAHRARVKDY